ncbi:hypothetical protein RFI_04213, partial [Reticulomyxa filosa]
MAAHGVFITDQKGKPLISRNYRGKIPLSVSEEFRRILAETEDAERRPIILENDITFVYVEHNDLFIASKHKQANKQIKISIERDPEKCECDADIKLPVQNRGGANLSILFFFDINCDELVFEDYFGGLEQESIRDNFVLIYELFDEMCDFGYPQHTDPKMLKDYICVQEKHKLEFGESSAKAVDLTASITGKVPWRKEGISYKKNEVFLDVVEKLNLL